MLTSANAPALSSPLHLGSVGSAVRSLQIALNQPPGTRKLAEDGVFGKHTHELLVDYQRRKGLKPDGVVGPATATALGWRFDTSSSKSIQLKQSWLPYLTPPLEVLHEIIREEMDIFVGSLLNLLPHEEEVTQSIEKSRDGINSDYRRFLNDLKAHFKDLHQHRRDDFYVTMIKFDMSNFQFALLNDGPGMLGEYDKRRTRFDSLQTNQIGDAIWSMVRGRQTLQKASAQIRGVFRMVNAA